MEGLSKLFKSSERTNYQRFETRYEQTEENTTVMEIKIIICEILLLIFDIKNDFRMTLFMIEYRKNYEKSFKNKKSYKKMKLTKNSSMNIEMNKMESFKINQKINDDEFINPSDNDKKEFINKQLKWISEIIALKKIDFNENSPLDFIAIIFDLFLYKRKELKKISFKLILTYFTQIEKLSKLIHKIHLVVDKRMIANLKNCKEFNDKITDLVEKSEKWYNVDDKSSEENAKNFIGLIEKIIKLFFKRENINKLFKKITINEPDSEEIPKNSNIFDLDSVFLIY